MTEKLIDTSNPSETERVWVHVRPGEIALGGTQFAVRYEPRGSRSGDYRLYQGERKRGAYHQLETACRDAERLQDDIDIIMGDI